MAQEASALAAHLGLDNLILIYDSNNVTLDAMAPVTQSEDTAARYRAYGRRQEIPFLPFSVGDGHGQPVLVGAGIGLYFRP